VSILVGQPRLAVAFGQETVRDLAPLLARAARLSVRPSRFDWRAARPWARWVQRLARHTDRHVRDAYFARHPSRRLYLGCGKHRLQGWLHTDYYPRGKSAAEVMHLDASRRFPFEGGSFDYVYSEHLIEHLPLEHGVVMLMESFRVLKRSGRMRIGTPGFGFLVGLYEQPLETLHRRCIAHESDSFPCDDPRLARLVVINKFMRAWGHQFIYDEELLAALMELVGFVDIRAHAVAESDDPVLRNLANTARLPEGLLELTTFTLEGRKP
jgi:predicted SAM-dependent methyltransferase